MKNQFHWMRSAWHRARASLAESFLGSSMLVHVDDLRRYIAAAPSLPHNQDRAEVRLQASFITAVFLLLLAEPIYYIFTVPDAMLTRVTSLAWSRWCVVGSFGLCFLGAVPHLFTLLFRPDLLAVRHPRRWAAGAAVGAAVTWMVLANMAVPLDVGGVEGAYVIRAVVCLFIAGIFAVSVNAQQMREYINAAND